MFAASRKGESAQRFRQRRRCLTSYKLLKIGHSQLTIKERKIIMFGSVAVGFSHFSPPTGQNRQIRRAIR